MKKQPIHKHPLNLLVTRSDRLGDFVLTTPVFKALRLRYPEMRITCLTFCENGDLIRGNQKVDEVLLYDKKGRQKGLWGNLQFARMLARKKFDGVIHFHATNRMHGITWLAGIPMRIGYDRKCAWALTHRVKDLKHRGEHHEAEYNFDLLQFLDVPKPEKLHLQVPFQEKAEKSLKELFRQLQITKEKPWVVLHPSASCPSKKWSAERFAELSDQLQETLGVACFVIGASKDSAVTEKMKVKTRKSFFDLTGRLSIAMLAHFLKQADLLISNDSGPVHIATAVETPVISIFGRNLPGLSPKRWGPLGETDTVIWKDVGCEKCLAHRCQINFLCLDVISVSDVLNIAQEKIKEVIR